jgi:hypothetical protein
MEKQIKQELHVGLCRLNPLQGLCPVALFTKIKILHLGQGSFTRKVRTIFTLKIIVSIFVKLFLILVLHLRQYFIIRIFVKRATGQSPCKGFRRQSPCGYFINEVKVIFQKSVF